MTSSPVQITLPRDVAYSLMLVARERAKVYAWRAENSTFVPEPGRENLDATRARNLPIAADAIEAVIGPRGRGIDEER